MNKELLNEKELTEIQEKRRREFLTKELVCLDSSFQPRADRSVYVYVEQTETSNHLWYVFNDGCVYYSVFEDLNSLMEYVNGCLYTRLAEIRYLCLTEQDMKIVDKDL